MFKILIRSALILTLVFQFQISKSQSVILGSEVSSTNTYGVMKAWHSTITGNANNFKGIVESRIGASTIYSSYGHGSAVSGLIKDLKTLRSNSSWHALAVGGRFDVTLNNATLYSSGTYQTIAAGVYSTISGSLSSYSGSVYVSALYAKDKINSSKSYAAIFEGKVSVNGQLQAKEFLVEDIAADYVFSKDFNLRPLSEVETFIKANGHLPDVAPASETSKGVNLSEFNSTLLQKIEELTLYVIDLEKELDKLKSESK